jgi:hypothetical protein
MSFKSIAAAVTTFAALALFVVACSSTPGSPASPSSLIGGSANLEPGICSDGLDNEEPAKDADKLIDCDDPDCATSEECKTPPPPGGPACSPGWWKQTDHEDEFEDACAEVELETGGDWTCAELEFAINCNGGPSQVGPGGVRCTGANRQAAAALLNATSIFPAGGCTE